MHSITTTVGRRFEASETESLLDAALRQGVVLDHSCRTGRCSACKGRVLFGDTVAVHDELGLSHQDRAAGFVLTCVRQARGQVSLEIDDLGDITLPEAKTLPCRIHSLQRLARDVLHVTLRLPPSIALHFLPGQYLEVIGVDGLRRSYSIANAPRADKQIELHIREVPEGAMSRYWFGQARVNDLLRLRGPLGSFFLRDEADRDLVLLATGTGIAPVKAIIEGLAAAPTDQRPRSSTVYWGGRHPEDLYWPAPQNANVRFVPVLSRAAASWEGARGHVQEALLHAEPDLSRTSVYACGSDAMIQSARAKLLGAGLPERHFHSDAFVCSAAA